MVEHAFQLETRAKDARDSYHRFVNGVVDAVDTGRVSRPALAELEAARRKLGELAAIAPTHEVASAAADLEPVARVLAADASVASALTMQSTIRNVDRRLDDWVNEYDHRQETAIVASIAGARWQSTVVVAAALFTIAAALYFLYGMIKGLTEPLAQAVRTAERVARGDLSPHSTLDRRKDLDGLLGSLASMEHSLYEYRQQVEQRTRPGMRELDVETLHFAQKNPVFTFGGSEGILELFDLPAKSNDLGWVIPSGFVGREFLLSAFEFFAGRCI